MVSRPTLGRPCRGQSTDQAGVGKVDGRDVHFKFSESKFCHQVTGKVHCVPLISDLNIHCLAFLEKISLHRGDFEAPELNNEGT